METNHPIKRVLEAKLDAYNAIADARETADDKAATDIQRVWRGFTDRKKIKEERLATESKAAVTIQRNWRGFAERKKIKEEQAASPTQRVAETSKPTKTKRKPFSNLHKTGKKLLQRFRKS